MKRFTIKPDPTKQTGPVPAHANLVRDTNDLSTSYTDSPITADVFRQRGFIVLDARAGGKPYDGTDPSKRAATASTPSKTSAPKPGASNA